MLHGEAGCLGQRRKRDALNGGENPLEELRVRGPLVLSVPPMRLLDVPGVSPTDPPPSLRARAGIDALRPEPGQGRRAGGGERGGLLLPDLGEAVRAVVPVRLIEYQAAGPAGRRDSCPF